MPLLTYYTTVAIESRADCLRHEVDPADVPADVKRAADRACREVAPTLGLAPPGIRWLPMAVRDIRGIVFAASPHELWVKLQSSEAATAETVSHELRHLQQIRDHAPMAEREADADRFGRSVRSRFEAGRPLADRPAPPKRPAPAPPAPARRAVASTVPATRRETPVLRSSVLIHDVKGVRYADCAPCGAMVRVGTTHRCPSPAGSLAQQPYAGGKHGAPSYSVKVIR